MESIVFDPENGRVQDSGETPILKYTNSNHYIGLYSQYAFRPASAFRPLVGAGILRWVGDTVDGKEAVPESLGTFAAPSVWMMQFKGGAEFEASRLIDLFVHVPVTVNLGGSSSDTFSKGEALNPETGQAYIDTGSDKPPSPPAVGGGLIVGMQLKFLGRKFK